MYTRRMEHACTRVMRRTTFVETDTTGPLGGSTPCVISSHTLREEHTDATTRHSICACPSENQPQSRNNRSSEKTCHLFGMFPSSS
jgi:hypothetical protein